MFLVLNHLKQELIVSEILVHQNYRVIITRQPSYVDMMSLKEIVIQEDSFADIQSLKLTSIDFILLVTRSSSIGNDSVWS